MNSKVWAGCWPGPGPKSRRRWRMCDVRCVPSSKLQIPVSGEKIFDFGAFQLFARRRRRRGPKLICGQRFRVPEMAKAIRTGPVDSPVDSGVSSFCPAARVLIRSPGEKSSNGLCALPPLLHMTILAFR